MFLLEQVVNGLVLGGYYLLIALGLSLIFSVGGVVNLAHGAFYALGAYLSVEIVKYLGFAPAVVLSPVAVALIGILFERFILRRFYTADPILSLLVTFGLAMVTEQAIRIIWGAAPLSAAMPPALKGSVILGDFLFSRYRLLLLGVVALVLAGVWLLLHKTSFGRVVRAGIQRPDMVAALGIRLQPYMTAVVMLGVGMAAMGGAFFAPITIVHPAMGAEIITVAFVVVVIGGPRQLLGRGARRAAGRRGARRHDPLRGRGGRSLDLRADVPGAAVPPARPARRAHREIRMTLLARYRPLWIALIALIALPFAMRLLGLTITHRLDGGDPRDRDARAQPAGRLHRAHLVRAQRVVRHRRLRGRRSRNCTGSRTPIALPILLSMLFVAVLSTVVGFLILRRRGVYFSLLTLALAALTYTIAFRWTEVTGGEDGLGGLKRGSIGPVSLDDGNAYLHRGRADRARRAVPAAARRRARRSAMCWWRSARTSCAPRSRAIRSSATSSWRS